MVHIVHFGQWDFCHECYAWYAEGRRGLVVGARLLEVPVPPLSRYTPRPQDGSRTPPPTVIVGRPRREESP